MDENNIIKTGIGTIIMNGGNPINDCPTDLATAERWAATANGEAEIFERPLWSWDCGYKLDFDGPILRISSRFYPPKTHYGPTWDGTVTVCIFDQEIETKKFDCPTLDELKTAVETYLESLRVKVQNLFIEAIKPE